MFLVKMIQEPTKIGHNLHLIDCFENYTGNQKVSLMKVFPLNDKYGAFVRA